MRPHRTAVPAPARGGPPQERQERARQVWQHEGGGEWIPLQMLREKWLTDEGHTGRGAVLVTE